ncbi:MAG: hypothetical protein IJ746_08160 [Ruminococcus sp.]|nr:hypothetical protein [Ruminococcus sp.]
MKYIKQEETAFTPHGHWNTLHTVVMSRKDALEILDMIDKAYPNAFIRKDGMWHFEDENYNALPVNVQSIVQVLETILNSTP